MKNNLDYANTVTPTPTKDWKRMSDEERLEIVKKTLALKSSVNNIFVPTAARQDGQVIFKLLEPLSAAERGTRLLNLEALLKDTVDLGLSVWLESLGDRSSLRNLRGIEVKS